MVSMKREPLPPNTSVENEWVNIELGEGTNKQTFLTKRVRLGALYDVCSCDEIQEQLGRGERIDNICPYCNHLQVEIDYDLEKKERVRMVNRILELERYSLSRLSRTTKKELEGMTNEKLFSRLKCTEEMIQTMGVALYDKETYEIPCISCGLEVDKMSIKCHDPIEIEPDEFGYNIGSICIECYKNELERNE